MNRPSWRIVLRYGSAVAFVLAVLFLMWNTRILIMRSIQSHMDSAGYHDHGLKESQYANEVRQTMPDLSKFGWEVEKEDKQCECPDNSERVEEEKVVEKDYGDDIKTCEPVTKVAFAKTHKTGSSTVQNILLRYGVKHDLTFAMPPNSWMFHIIDAFDADQVLLGPWRHLEFDIFAFHCRWNYDEVHRILPDAKFMTILREPLATFESNYVYMGAQNARKADLNEFAERFAAKGEKRNPKAYVGQNNLLWDLGVDAKQLDNMEVAEAKIKEVEEKFEMVMIMERFEESLVLLADAFCWPLEEVTYIKQNERVAEIRNVPTEKTKEIMRKWLRGDYKVMSTYFTLFLL